MKSINIYFSITKCDIYVGVNDILLKIIQKLFLFPSTSLKLISFMYIMSSKVLSLLLLVQKHQPIYNFQITIHNLY